MSRMRSLGIQVEPTTPDASDLNKSKRRWEAEIMRWRICLKEFGDDNSMFPGHASDGVSVEGSMGAPGQWRRGKAKSNEVYELYS